MLAVKSLTREKDSFTPWTVFFCCCYLRGGPGLVVAPRECGESGLEQVAGIFKDRPQNREVVCGLSVEPGEAL